MDVLKQYLDIAALFKKHPSMENLYCLIMLAVHPNYRRRGIAGILVEESLKDVHDEMKVEF